jgi:uncharacterized protein (DUF58 family)
MNLTTRGIGVLVGSAGLVAVGLVWGYPESTGVGAAGLVAVVLAAADTLVRARVTVRRGVDRPVVMRGDADTVRLTLTNAGRRPVRVHGWDVCGPQRLPVAPPRLGRRSTVGLAYPVPTGRRGVLKTGPLRLTRTDPFGLAVAARDAGPAATIWVHPYVHSVHRLPPGRSPGGGEGERVAYGSVAFAALREYVPGDDLRYVHWRTTARAGTLMVRDQVDAGRPRLVVVLDDRAAAHDGDSFEHACEAAASLLAAGVRANWRATLVTCGRAPVAAEPGSVAHLVALAEAVPSSGGDRPADLAGILRRLDGDLVVCLTGAVADAPMGTVMAATGERSTAVVGLFGPPAPPGPAPPGVRVVSAADAADFLALWERLWA